METFIEDGMRIRRQSLRLMVPLFSITGLIWGAFYYYHGAIISAIIPSSYAVVSIFSLLLLKWQKSFAIFRGMQLFLILVLPMLLHLSLGNFVSSSGIIVWSTLCPLGALAFQNSKAAGYWLLAFLIMTLSVVFLEYKVFPVVNNIPNHLVSILFFLNISAVTFLVYFLLRYFVNQNELVKVKLEKEQALLAREREKSEGLLLNILPAAIAKRLKDGEVTIADHRDNTIVLFADIVGFTHLSQQSTPELLVNNLNQVFTYFDTLVEAFQLEKIKTIGDAYMVAGGLTCVQQDDAHRMAALALEMCSGVQQYSLDGQATVHVRIGIDVGTVIAGVIGSKKLIYDVWGDTVNTASRMESTGEAGRIQVTEKFYDRIKDEFDCEYRGQTDIKGKGMMRLYYLNGEKQRP